MKVMIILSFFFFNDTATTEIYTLSLHDALPICDRREHRPGYGSSGAGALQSRDHRSEEHTSELQSRFALVCRLLLDKKKNTVRAHPMPSYRHTKRRRLNTATPR